MEGPPTLPFTAASMASKNLQKPPGAVQPRPFLQASALLATPKGFATGPRARRAVRDLLTRVNPPKGRQPQTYQGLNHARA
jgi:hypothetical protein